MPQDHRQQGRHGAGTQHDQLRVSGASNQLDHRYRNKPMRMLRPMAHR